MEKVRPWCGQLSDRGRLKNGTGATHVLRTVPVYIQVCVGSIKSTVSGYLSVGQDQSLADCGRRWFELSRDAVLYSFSRLTVSSLKP